MVSIMYDFDDSQCPLFIWLHTYIHSTYIQISMGYCTDYGHMMSRFQTLYNQNRNPKSKRYSSEMSEKLNFLKQPKHLKYVGKTPNTYCVSVVRDYLHLSKQEINFFLKSNEMMIKNKIL